MHMAGLLSGDVPHHGTYEGLSNKHAQDKPEDGGRWYFSRKEIEENSPSRRDGVDLKLETKLRKSYCTFLRDLGQRLKVPQLTIATATVFCHRFFLRQSHAKNDRRTIATACMFLAGKVEETPRPVKDVILLSHEIVNEKDPAAIQRIKQKEVYEQQKELILLGERIVLATLGFDLNVQHPYNLLIEAIKKFEVAGYAYALAQVAWNFVNDGLRTSLSLQFKPRQIAAGAIFIAAKFLKIKLPSDGEKVWWREFDVTPRQLEEISSQMLELYEQNRAPSSSDVEGSARSGATHSHRGTLKATNSNEEHLTTNSHSQAGSTRLGATKAALSGPSSGLSNAESQGGPRATESRSNDYGNTEMKTVLDHKKDGEFRDDPAGEGQKILRLGFDSEGTGEEVDQQDNVGRNEMRESGGLKDKHYNLENRQSILGQSLQEAIKKIDKDKVKAALEKRRKSIGDVARKTDLMDDDDLIERELEDGIELASGSEKNKQGPESKLVEEHEESHQQEAG